MRRRVKRDMRRIIVGIVTACVVITAAVLLGFSVRNVIPLLKIGSEQKDAIIKPVSQIATIDDLSKRLSDKNIIMESLTEGSSSGIINGKIKDGPNVYFSKNKDVDWQVLSLELILTKLTVDSKKPAFVDLTGKQPIVKF